MDTRRHHRDLTASQKTAFIKAVLAVKNEKDSVLHPGAQSRYDDFVEVHKNAMLGPAMFDPMPHGTPLFYPWHRVLLRQFELALQSIDPIVTIPYWDWDPSGPSNPFTATFLGGDGDASQGDRVTTGPFAFSAGKFPIRVWDDTTGDAGLRRELGDDATSWLPTPNEVTAGLAKTPYSPGPSSFQRVLEGVLHNPVHRWVGGNMADATSPNDPVFFLHHGYLDLLWERWKVQHPTSDPYRPVSGAPGFDLDSTLVFNAPNQPAPWQGTWTVRQALVPAELGYVYA
jgi:tyrosinase